jgi:hypothetical protein
LFSVISFDPNFKIAAILFKIFQESYNKASGADTAPQSPETRVVVSASCPSLKYKVFVERVVVLTLEGARSIRIESSRYFLIVKSFQRATKHLHPLSPNTSGQNF